MFDELNDLYQQVILDHSKTPRNFRLMPAANRSSQGYNPLCGDNVTLYLEMDGDRVKDVSFQGSGCAISKASASILTEAIKGKTKEEAKQLFERIHDLVMTGGVGAGGVEGLGKLAVFAGVHKYPARVKCAILPWHAAIAALDGKDAPVSTE